MGDTRIVAPFLKRVVDVLAAALKSLIEDRIRFSKGPR